VETKREVSLPENAFRELRPGESYVPIVSASATIAEASARAFALAFVLNVLFSMAAAYIALKLGQGIETAIPIAILAVGLSAAFKRRSTLLENVNIVAFGATSGIIVGGAVFTLPALFILGIDYLSSLFQLFFVAFFGAVLGVLFLIPFRRYFVEDMHGKLPFPEGTATTEILVAGEKGGAQARLLAIAMVCGGIYDFVVISLHLWSESFTTSLVGFMSPLTDRVKIVFSTNTSAAILGLGYIIGVRYTAIIFAGSMLSWFVLVPLFAHLAPAAGAAASGAGAAAGAAGAAAVSATAEEIFYGNVRYIGIGAIFVAGLVGILKLSPVIVQAMRSGMKELALSRKAHAGEHSTSRTDRDIPMSIVSILFIVTIALLWVYFRFGVLRGEAAATSLSFIALAVTVIISFLFASVSARAVAMIGVTPISGMTLMTLVVASIVMVRAGLKGDQGMLSALLIGGVVCTALSTTATLVTEFKIGYWLGATPRKIQIANIAGAAVAAVVVSLVIVLLDKVYGFAPGPTHPNPLPAPQPNAMAAVIKSLMSSAQAPWFLYGMGGVIALVVEMLGISGLAFALGMYIPIELNAPLLIGAIVAWLVARRNRAGARGEGQQDRGTLIASGLIAGGALIGVVSSLIKWIEAQSGKTIIHDFNNTGPAGNAIALVAFVALCVAVYVAALDRKRGEKG
jgi:putative OPT family oligopeptide transporter